MSTTRYNSCPDCGGPKDVRAAHCRACKGNHYVRPVTSKRGHRNGPETITRLTMSAVRTEQGCLLPTTVRPMRGTGYVRVMADESSARPHPNGKGSLIQLHRLAYIVANGPIPDGLTVDHECHNRDLSCAGGPECLHRACFEPTHLVLRAQRENWIRGRLGADHGWPNGRPS